MCLTRYALRVLGTQTIISWYEYDAFEFVSLPDKGGDDRRTCCWALFFNRVGVLCRKEWGREGEAAEERKQARKEYMMVQRGT